MSSFQNHATMVDARLLAPAALELSSSWRHQMEDIERVSLGSDIKLTQTADTEQPERGWTTRNQNRAPRGWRFRTGSTGFRPSVPRPDGAMQPYHMGSTVARVPSLSDIRTMIVAFRATRIRVLRHRCNRCAAILPGKASDLTRR